MFREKTGPGDTQILKGGHVEGVPSTTPADLDLARRKKLGLLGKSPENLEGDLKTLLTQFNTYLADARAIESEENEELLKKRTKYTQALSAAEVIMDRVIKELDLDEGHRKKLRQITKYELKAEALQTVATFLRVIDFEKNVKEIVTWFKDFHSKQSKQAKKVA